MKAFMKYAPLVLAGALAVPFAAAADKADKSEPLSDQEFLDKAAQGNQAEIQLGQLAETNAASDDVKAFGQRMVKDHTTAQEKVMDVAKEVKVSVPTSVGKEDKTLAQKLSSLKGAEFDKMYMKHMVEDHEKDVSMFENESQRATDPKVKALAAELLPVLQEHLKLARSVNEKVNGK